VQTIVVSLIALAALALVARRVVLAVRPPAGKDGQAACPSCVSGSDACATGDSAAPSTTR
jgi:hypothetical protein